MRNNYLDTEQVVVDTDNLFSYKGFEFKIREDDEDYRTIDKPDEVYDWKNESKMTYVNAVLGRDFKLYFYNQDWVAIPNVEFKKP